MKLVSFPASEEPIRFQEAVVLSEIFGEVSAKAPLTH